MLDRTTLCLACSSSLPPNVDDSDLFMTKCCGRPICPRCLETNPRLKRYNPCLACLAGVGVVQASSIAKNRLGGKPVGGAEVRSVKVENLDGGVKDHDLFALGDDDDEDSEDEDVSMDEAIGGRFPRSATPTPPDVVQTTFPLPKTPPPPPITDPAPTPPVQSEDPQPSKPTAPAVYRLRRGDTLTGIALRFRLDAMELCRLNNLPTTTLSTTPHLLHTRTTILLCPTSKSPTEDSELPEARRVERAEKRLQMDPDSSKEKSDAWEVNYGKIPDPALGGSSQKGVLESDAIGRYLEDMEWEEEERKDGRGPAIQRFPWSSLGQKVEQSPGTQRGASGFKWPWNA